MEFKKKIFLYRQMSFVLQKLLTNVRFRPFLREHNFQNSEIFAKNREKKKKKWILLKSCCLSAFDKCEEWGEESCQKHKIVFG